MSAEQAFAAAVLARLSGEAAVRAALGDPARCHDRAPAGAAFPFLALGRGESEPAGADGAALIDHRLTLQIVTREDDPAPLREALAAVRAALHERPVAMAAGWRCAVLRVVYADLFTRAGGPGLLGVVRVRGLIEATIDV